MENPGSKPSISLHIYGCDMGTQKRRKYDPNTGRVEWYTTPHDTDEVIMIRPDGYVALADPLARPAILENYLEARGIKPIAKWGGLR